MFTMETPNHYSHASMSDISSNQSTDQSINQSINQPAYSDMLKIYNELIDCSTICSKYCLMFSAQFSAELATQMNFQPDESINQSINQPPPVSKVSRPLFTSPNTDNQSINQSINQYSLPVTDPRVLLAKSYFDLREYAQCAHSLEHLSINQSINQSKRDSHANFIYLYSIYLSGEQKCVEKKREISGSFGPGLAQLDAHQSIKQSINHSIPLIRSAFDQIISHGYTLDPFECYLYALIEYHQSFTQSNTQIITKQKSIDWLLQSINQFPLNWSSWLLLSKLLLNSSELTAVTDRLPSHFMRSFFFLHFFVVVIFHENSHANTLLDIFEKLFVFFPKSKTLLFLEAVYHHHQGNYDESAHLFAAVYKMFPDCMQYRDLYSNILFIKEDHVGLSMLAHDCIKRSKYTEEVCIVFGNYYSLKRQHEKALSYFQRAFMLNPSYHWALTLMGHELVELQNLSAAIAVYRRALDCDERDYRAWHACGNAYETLMLPRCALYYYTQARRLRPYDARLWVAEAECYDKCGMQNESLACFEQAVECDDEQGSALNKLAALHDKRGEQELAARRYMQLLHRIELQQQSSNPSGDQSINPDDPFFMPGGIPQEGVVAVTFLAGYYLSLGDLSTAESFCQRLIECGGPAKTQALTWQQDIHKKRSEAASLLASTSASTPKSGQPIDATPTMQHFTPTRPALSTRSFFDTPQS